MADSISKITVKIGGMNYQLLAAENEVYMRQVAAHADEMIRRVMQNSPHLTLSMSTVLALVNAVDEQYNARKSMENAEHKSAEAEKKLDEMKSELMRCREQTWEIKKDLLHYQNLCKEYEELLERETMIDKGAADISSTIRDDSTDEKDELSIDNNSEYSEAADNKNDLNPHVDDFHPFEQTRLDDYLQERSANSHSGSKQELV